MLDAVFLRDQTTKQIKFVAFGDGDQRVGPLGLGLDLDIVIGAVADDAANVICVDRLLHDRGVDINNDDIVAFVREIFGNNPADFPDADNDYFHA